MNHMSRLVMATSSFVSGLNAVRLPMSVLSVQKTPLSNAMKS